MYSLEREKREFFSFFNANFSVLLDFVVYFSKFYI